MAKSLADDMMNSAFDALEDVFGIEVSYRFREDLGTDFKIRGVFDRLGVITKVVDGFPAESKAVTIGFRKSDFTENGRRQPAQGDRVIVPDDGTFEILEVANDDGIEAVCALREIKNA